MKFDEEPEKKELQIDNKKKPIEKTRIKQHKVEVLTDELVYNFIKENRGKKSGYGTLWKVINRHKAVDVALLNAIIEIHRKFKEFL